MQDAATLFNVTRWLRVMTNKLGKTTLVSLLQPPPETLALFDDVMIMNEGTIVFHGPVPDAVPFMTSLGFALPPRKVRVATQSLQSCGSTWALQATVGAKGVTALWWGAGCAVVPARDDHGSRPAAVRDSRASSAVQGGRRLGR